MWINRKPLYLYGGKLRMDYTYSPPELSNEYFKGRKRSGFVLLESSYGLGKLSLPIVFEGIDRKDVTLKKSMFEKEIFGQSDIIMGDDYMYFAILEGIGEASYPSEQLIEVAYEFKCIRHGKYREVQANTVYCESTLPVTDCLISTTVGNTGNNYRLGTVIFPNVTKGEKLAVDGINKRILVNGAPAANRAEWTKFPSLVPGKNNISCPDQVIVEYYPVYF